MLRTSDIKHPDLAKAIEEGQPLELVGMDVEHEPTSAKPIKATNGTPGQSTRAGCSWQKGPTGVERTPWRPVPLFSTIDEFLSCCGCSFQWTHNARQRLGLLCPPPGVWNTVLIPGPGTALAWPAIQPPETWTAEAKPEPTPTQQQAPSADCPPEGSPTGSTPLTKGCSDV